MQHILVGSVDVVDGNDGNVAVVTEIAEGDASTGLDGKLVNLLLGNIQSDGDREEDSAGKTDVLNNSEMVLAICKLLSYRDCVYPL